MDVKKINLGCGLDKRDGWINIDKSKGVNPDLLIDIEKEVLPFSMNEVDEILCKHTLEHLSNIDHLLNEMHRVLKPEGKALIIIPSMNHPEIFSPNHKTFCTKETLTKYMTMEWSKVCYGVRTWEILEAIENDRKEVHIIAKPKK